MTGAMGIGIDIAAQFSSLSDDDANRLAELIEQTLGSAWESGFDEGAGSVDLDSAHEAGYQEGYDACLMET